MNPETDRRGHDILKRTSSQVARRALERHNAGHCTTVEEGGGEYVPGMMGDLVLFNSKATGSTLALPEKELTAEAVARKILLSNKSFGK